MHERHGTLHLGARVIRRGSVGVLDFPAAGAHVQLPTKHLYSRQGLSISVWLRPTRFGGDPDYRAILSVLQNHAVNLNPEGRLAIFQYGSRPGGFHLSRSKLNLNAWNHVAYTYNGKMLAVYLNEKKDLSLSVYGSIKTQNTQGNQSAALGVARAANGLHERLPPAVSGSDG